MRNNQYKLIKYSLKSEKLLFYYFFFILYTFNWFSIIYINKFNNKKQLKILFNINI